MDHTNVSDGPEAREFLRLLGVHVDPRTETVSRWTSAEDPELSEQEKMLTVPLWDASKAGVREVFFPRGKAVSLATGMTTELACSQQARLLEYQRTGGHYDLVEDDGNPHAGNNPHAMVVDITGCFRRFTRGPGSPRSLVEGVRLHVLECLRYSRDSTAVVTSDAFGARPTARDATTQMRHRRDFMSPEDFLARFNGPWMAGAPVHPSMEPARLVLVYVAHWFARRMNPEHINRGDLPSAERWPTAPAFSGLSLMEYVMDNCRPARKWLFQYALASLLPCQSGEADHPIYIQADPEMTTILAQAAADCERAALDEPRGGSPGAAGDSPRGVLDDGDDDFFGDLDVDGLAEQARESAAAAAESLAARQRVANMWMEQDMVRQLRTQRDSGLYPGAAGLVAEAHIVLLGGWDNEDIVALSQGRLEGHYSALPREAHWRVALDTSVPDAEPVCSHTWGFLPDWYNTVYEGDLQDWVAVSRLPCSSVGLRTNDTDALIQGLLFCARPRGRPVPEDADVPSLEREPPHIASRDVYSSFTGRRVSVGDMDFLGVLALEQARNNALAMCGEDGSARARELARWLAQCATEEADERAAAEGGDRLAIRRRVRRNLCSETAGGWGVSCATVFPARDARVAEAAAAERMRVSNLVLFQPLSGRGSRAVGQATNDRVINVTALADAVAAHLGDTLGSRRDGRPVGAQHVADLALAMIVFGASDATNGLPARRAESSVEHRTGRDSGHRGVSAKAAVNSWLRARARLAAQHPGSMEMRAPDFETAGRAYKRARTGRWGSSSPTRTDSGQRETLVPALARFGAFRSEIAGGRARPKLAQAWLIHPEALALSTHGLITPVRDLDWRRAPKHPRLHPGEILADILRAEYQVGLLCDVWAGAHADAETLPPVHTTWARAVRLGYHTRITAGRDVHFLPTRFVTSHQLHSETSASETADEQEEEEEEEEEEGEEMYED